MELQSGAIKIEFDKVGDRFAHRVLRQRHDTWLLVLESIEGTAEERWPASPPLQQIVAEPIGKDSRIVLLGVGLSGTGHWSISVDENDAGGLLMDNACRVSGEHGFLGSTWNLASDWQIDQSGNQPNGTLRLVHATIQDLKIELTAVHGGLECTSRGSSSSVFNELNTSPVIVSRPTGRDLYPKPHRWAVRCRTVD